MLYQLSYAHHRQACLRQAGWYSHYSATGAGCQLSRAVAALNERRKLCRSFARRSQTAAP